jgi:thioredoxin-related protein
MKHARFIPFVLAAIFIGSTSFVVIKKMAAKKGEEKIEWLSIEEAYKKNEKKPRKIFVDVYTDWCGWCKVMERNTFSNADVIEYVNKNYYAVRLNAEGKSEVKMGDFTTTEQGVANAFNVNSYPTIVFLEKDFKTFTPQPGYREPQEFLSDLKKFKEKADAK